MDEREWELSRNLRTRLLIDPEMYTLVILTISSLFASFEYPMDQIDFRRSLGELTKATGNQDKVISLKGGERKRAP